MTTNGIRIIREYVKNLPTTPGVYRMSDATGAALYVGKARNLKRRVSSYTHEFRLSLRLRQMVSQTAEMAFLVTRSEIEALLLEASLIKTLQPRYNVLLRDDKSLPHIVLTATSRFPGLYKHRGGKKKGEVYFGPFASPTAVKDTLAALHKTFLLRMCSDNVFNRRSRPCLEYQIKRCSAPCVGYISQEEYADAVCQAKRFLSGDSRQVRQEFTSRMLAASQRQDFETAGRYRDRLRSLSEIQAYQAVHVPNIGDSDVIVIVRGDEMICAHAILFRNNHHCGERSYFLSCPNEMSLEEAFGEFLTQYYHLKQIPSQLLLSHPPAERNLLVQALRFKKQGSVTLRIPKQGKKKEIIEYALNNARQALERSLSEKAKNSAIRAQIAKIFHLPRPPTRIEVFDNSHQQGEHGVCALIAADAHGFDKHGYRRYHFSLNDDYAMIQEALRRRFAENSSPLPDLILIDGGIGHLNASVSVLRKLNLSAIPVIAMAKGRQRTRGQETFFQQGFPPVQLTTELAALYFLQRLRDEAHRFAIGGYRKRHKKSLISSPLDRILGIGPRRKQRLLHHFGSMKSISRSGVQDLQAVEGINQEIARRIYDFFHS